MSDPTATSCWWTPRLRDTDLFDAESIDDLLLRYERLMVAALAAPQTRVGALALFDSDERGPRGDAQGPPRGRCCEEASGRDTLADAFLAQARRTPAAPAVSGGGRTLTYDELSDRAPARARLACRRSRTGRPRRHLAARDPTC